MKNLFLILAILLLISVKTEAQQYSDLYLKVEELKNTKFNLPPKDSRGDCYTPEGWASIICDVPCLRINDKLVNHTDLNSYQLNNVYRIWYVATTPKEKLYKTLGSGYSCMWGSIIIFTNDYKDKNRPLQSTIFTQYYPEP
jgi:hypothetical protein